MILLAKERQYRLVDGSAKPQPPVQTMRAAGRHKRAPR
jgi:hypothetical protein